MHPLYFAAAGFGIRKFFQGELLVSNGPRILVIDDEPQIRRFLRTGLSGHQYAILEAPTGNAGLDLVASTKPDLVILDLGLPDLDGVDLICRLREWSQVPIIVLSVREREQDKIAALDAGADDYLTKPFGIGELLARVRVALRHTSPAAEEPVFQTGELKVDLARRWVTMGDREIRLTPTEYAILRFLVGHAGKVVTHQQLLRGVWGPEYQSESHYIRVYVGQLRHKLERDPARPEYILTEPGVGYRLRVDEMN
jgi:two-component system, OmpR family, KDP operon response regulator KdpE